MNAVPVRDLPELLELLAISAERARLRLTEELRTAPDVSPSVGDDQLIDAREAACRLGMTVSWLYQHWRELPFASRVGPRALRFSARGIRAYLNAQNGGEGD